MILNHIHFDTLYVNANEADVTDRNEWLMAKLTHAYRNRDLLSIRQMYTKTVRKCTF